MPKVGAPERRQALTPRSWLADWSGFFGWRGGLDQDHADVARNGRNVALGGNLFLRLRAGKDELHLLGGGGRFRVRPHHQDLTDPADRILNQLPRRDRHGAVGIDFHHDVVQPQTGSLGLGEGALLGIRPVFVCRSFERARRIFSCGAFSWPPGPQSVR